LNESAIAADFLDVALLVARAIEKCGGEYFVGGSVASSVHGEPRATNDIDFVLSLPVGRVGELAEALGTDFEADVDMLRTALLHASTAKAAPMATLVGAICDGFGECCNAQGDPFDRAWEKPAVTDGVRKAVGAATARA
jgi:hypothetical protein